MICYHVFMLQIHCLTYLNLHYVAVNIKELDSEVSRVIASACAPNTKSTRNSQSKNFIITFCVSNNMVPRPAAPETVARYLVYLARSVKYTTINNYTSAINKLHERCGHNINFREFFSSKWFWQACGAN